MVLVYLFYLSERDRRGVSGRNSRSGFDISLMLGIVSLTLWRQTMGNFSWIFIAVGIIIVFLSSGVILQRTSL
jgi:hypothetical protein